MEIYFSTFAFLKMKVIAIFFQKCWKYLQLNNSNWVRLYVHGIDFSWMKSFQKHVSFADCHDFCKHDFDKLFCKIMISFHNIFSAWTNKTKMSLQSSSKMLLDGYRGRGIRNLKNNFNATTQNILNMKWK